MSVGRCGRCHNSTGMGTLHKERSTSTPMLLSLQPPDSEGFRDTVCDVECRSQSSCWGGSTAGTTEVVSCEAGHTWIGPPLRRQPLRPLRRARSIPTDLTAFPLDLSAFKEHMIVTKALSRRRCAWVSPVLPFMCGTPCLLSAFVVPFDSGVFFFLIWRCTQKVDSHCLSL